MERGCIYFFGKQFESNGEKRRIWRTPEILAHVHAIERTITVQCEDSDKEGTVSGEFFNDCSCIDIRYYPEKRDDNTCYLKNNTVKST